MIQNNQPHIESWADLVIFRTFMSIMGRKVVVTNGCFDVLHRGHCEMLRRAKAEGDILIVGLNSDSSVQALKGPTRPINNQADRKYVLESLSSVDYVHIFYSPRATDFLKICRPDVYIKSADYSLDSMDPNERKALEEMGAIIKFFPLVKGLSSTNIIKRI